MDDSSCGQALCPSVLGPRVVMADHSPVGTCSSSLLVSLVVSLHLTDLNREPGIGWSFCWGTWCATFLS